MGSRRNATNARWNTRREGGGPEGLSPPTDSGFSLDDDRKAEIEATFKRIHRPLRWPMENFRRRYISNQSFVGYRFSRIRRNAHAGFSLPCCQPFRASGFLERVTRATTWPG